jgi:hypothetical protein
VTDLHHDRLYGLQGIQLVPVHDIGVVVADQKVFAIECDGH